jgi:hypothetical protein
MPKPPSPGALRRTRAKLKRHGSTKVMRRLSDRQPRLADFLFEALSDLHGQLMALGGPPKATQKAYRRVRDLTLVLALLRP